MRIIAFLLSITAIVYLTGCCCCQNFKKNKTFSGPEKGSSVSSEANISPMEAAIKTKQLNKRMAELYEKISDPSLDSEERHDAEAELQQLQTEMEEMQKAWLNSDFIKNSNNPMIKKALEQVKRAKAEQERVMQEQQAIMEGLEQDLDDLDSGSVTYDEDFADDIKYMGDPENEITDDVYMPENF